MSDLSKRDESRRERDQLNERLNPKGIVVVDSEKLGQLLEKYPTLHPLLEFTECLSPQVWERFRKQGISETTDELKEMFIAYSNKRRTDYDWSRLHFLATTVEARQYLVEKLVSVSLPY